MTLLAVEGLVKEFAGRRSLVGRARPGHRAVDDVGFHLDAGETLALVGESGAGKSTTGRLVVRLIDPDAGSITFDGTDLRALDREQLRVARRHFQMVFQDPHSSLDPLVAVGTSVAEPLRIHEDLSATERRDRAGDLLRQVGLDRHHMNRRPKQLSGGQLQRVVIARALTLQPKLIVCDEPVAALDVSVRAQVINLLKDLQDEMGLAYLFITHDLTLMPTIAHRIAVMRNGRIVEIGPVDQILHQPHEPYTQQLIAAIPRLSRTRAGVAP